MRELGFYWIKKDSEWTVAEYVLIRSANKYCWATVWSDEEWEDKDFDEIDEKRIVRE
jgi:hypothetical protein